VTNNAFRIAGGKPGLKVSWQVTGIRHDAYAKAHPIIPEVEKSAEEQGLYLHPVEHGAAPALSIDRRIIQKIEFQAGIRHQHEQSPGKANTNVLK
jgi:hypothetical protein